MRSNTRLKMSEEMIKYTDKSLGNKLAYVFNQIYDILQENFSLNNEGLASVLKAKTEISLNEFIAQVIEEHTNIKTRVLLSSGIPGAIMVFPFNRNHIFLKDVLRDHYFLNDEKRILMESVGSKGSVDLKQGKVSGIFTTYVHALYLDLNLLFKTYGLSGF